MPLGQQIAGDLPYLRRYARALCGTQSAGDGLVRQLIEDAIADPAQRAALAGGKVELYRAFTALWRNAATAGEGGAVRSGGLLEAAAQAALARVTPANRQALLLIALEEFSPAEAARIMGASEAQVTEWAQSAGADIARDASASVLIIEDEPLIALQIESMVDAMGHRVCGIATTRDEARDMAARHRPELVLADIQLADGSSGLDAVDDILAIGPAAVVFITAFPERLLTGDRHEPTWLVAKPFREAAVRAAMAQALYLAGSNGQ